jgi:hypothetical protein
MPEIGTSGLMSGMGNGAMAKGPQATAPILDSTEAEVDLADAVDYRRPLDGSALSFSCKQGR